VPPNDPTLRPAAVVFAATPMLSIYPILAQKYGFEEMCAAALLLATVLLFFDNQHRPMAAGADPRMGRLVLMMVKPRDSRALSGRASPPRAER